MTRCCAINCNNKSKLGHHLYRFPSRKKHSNRRDLWISNVGAHTKNDSKEYRLCEQHFEHSHFSQRKIKLVLNSDAVPTLKLFNSNNVQVPSVIFAKDVYLDHSYATGMTKVKKQIC